MLLVPTHQETHGAVHRVSFENFNFVSLQASVVNCFVQM